MKFKSIAIPGPSMGVKITGKKIVVPDQSLSLQEILDRFTRGEPLEIGRDVQYHESDDDLEKMSHLDPVDKAEYIEKLKETQRKFDRQEKQKAAQEKKRLDELAVQKIANDKLAAEQAAAAHSKVNT